MSETSSSSPYVVWLRDSAARNPALVGGKAAHLAQLAQAELPVPNGFVVTTTAYHALVDGTDVPELIRTLDDLDPTDTSEITDAGAELRHTIQRLSIPEDIRAAIEDAYHAARPTKSFAVRSSATAEDLPETSFAGQHDTVLNVRDADSLVDAVRTCMASLFTDRAIVYRAHNGIPHDEVALAVVVQEMVEPDASGILFTADPTTGDRTVAVIDAGFGLGEAQVGGAVVSDHARIEKPTGEIQSYDVGDKRIAVQPRRGGGTDPVELPEERRTARVLTDEEVRTLASIGVDVEELLGSPQDIEWALVDGAVVLLQSRPITTLPEQEELPPTEWTVPDSTLAYARVGPAELLPNPLSPLFKSLGEPILTTSSVEMAREFLGSAVFSAETYGVTTINGYAYYYISLDPSVLLRIVCRGLLALPKVLGDVDSLQPGTDRPPYSKLVETWDSKDVEALQAGELLSGIETMVHAAVEYYNGSRFTLQRVRQNEGLFTFYYNRFVKRPEDPPSQTFLRGFDSEPIEAEKALYDLATWCRAHPVLADVLHATSGRDVVQLLNRETTPDGAPSDEWTEWQQRFKTYLDEHGHTIYDLDLRTPVPATDPSLPFDTLTAYLEGDAPDPYERQRRLVEEREQATEEILSRLGFVRRRLFRRLVGQAQAVAPLRENMLAEVGRGWPVAQRLAAELGRRLVDAGAIEQADDVYWLESAELGEMVRELDGGEAALDDVTEMIRERKVAWTARKRLNPPLLLPEQIHIMGFDFDTERWMQRSGEASESVITGAGTSPGRVTGRACVILGPEDFEKLRTGDVLVARITAPAWTPLFTKAAAIVTDIGGPLSHGSIIAREYAIPAVLGTSVATERIRDGQQLTVDGTGGTVTILSTAPSESRL